MKHLFFLLFLFGAFCCTTEKKKKEKKEAKQERKIEQSLQKQLDEEFGKYKETVKPKDWIYYKAYDKTLSLWKTPFHQVNIQTTLGIAHIVVSGPKNGEPLVLLHGMNASSTMWYPNIKSLSKNYRVYAIDYLLEPGKSQLNGEVRRLGEILNWYNEIFKKLKLEKFCLIGASRGGWLAIQIALQQKSRIKSVVLLSPAQTFKWIPPGTKILSNITYTIAPKRKHLHGVLKTMSVNPSKIEPAYVEQYFLATQRAKFGKFFLQMKPYTDAELKSLSMPILVLIGDHDFINDDKCLERAKALLPRCKAIKAINAGHFLSMDQSNAVNMEILYFLKTTLSGRFKSEIQ